MSDFSTLVDFIVDLDLRDIPSEIVDKAKLHVLDTLAAGCAGAYAEETAILRKRYASELERAPFDESKAVLWGTELAASPLVAIFVNAIGAHSFELDDSGGCDHSGAVVVPALVGLLAHPEVKNVSGEDFLIAVIVGYEVARRIQDALGGYDAVNDQGWHSTGVCGAFGAAAAAAKILGLDRDKTAAALGLAGTYVGGTWAFMADGAMSKRLHVGRAAELGVDSALLALHGFTGPTQLFDTEWGNFITLYGGPGATAKALSVDLGVIWKISNAAVKPHASCRGTHSAVDAVAAVMEQHDLRVSDIEGVEVRTSRLLVDMCGSNDVKSLVEAQLSMPFAVAAIALDGIVGPQQMSEESRSRPELVDFMHRVQVSEDPKLIGGSVKPTLIFETCKGRLEVTGIAPLGSPENPMQAGQVIEKFMNLTGELFSTSKKEDIVREILNLDNVERVVSMNALLATR